VDFDFSFEQEAFRESVARFAADRAPGYLRRAEADELDPELLRALAEIGVTTMLFSPAVGGPGADAVTVGIAGEELGRRDPSLGLAVVFGVLGPHLVEGHGTAAVKQEVIPRLVAGETLLAMAMTEPEAGSDIRGMRSRASRRDGGWILSGTKTSVTGAAGARYAVVIAKTDSAGKSGHTAFLVDLEQCEGVARQRFRDLGGRFWGRGELSFDQVEVPEDWVLGEPGRALSIVLSGLDFNRAVLGLVCVGAALQAIEEVGSYAAGRTAFGGSLLTKQGVVMPLAEHATRLEAARWLCYRTLWLRDRGQRHVKEAAMCKWWAPRLAREAIHDCLLTYGHVGYSREHPVGQLMLDVMGSEIGDGTAQIQKLVIARELFGSEHNAL
jgi:cyclohexanecarboxyl-CoA dehydrogenase